jgi:hypothetical protein
MVANTNSYRSGAALLEERAPVHLFPDRRDARSRELLLRRVRAEFEEMPCLRLTLKQATRLFALREDVCARVLGTLVKDRALWRGLDGQYARPGR